MRKDESPQRVVNLREGIAIAYARRAVRERARNNDRRILVEQIVDSESERQHFIELKPAGQIKVIVRFDIGGLRVELGLQLGI